jgi:hypothetical protein
MPADLTSARTGRGYGPAGPGHTSSGPMAPQAMNVVVLWPPGVKRGRINQPDISVMSRYAAATAGSSPLPAPPSLTQRFDISDEPDVIMVAGCAKAAIMVAGCAKSGVGERDAG